MERKGEGLGLIYVVGTKTNSIFGLFPGLAKRRNKKLMEKLERVVKEDASKEKFNKVNYSEAYADNFARMYGYGPQLISALQKMSKDQEAKVNSWYKKEEKRQQMIISIAIDMIKDSHKTDIHRAKSLIEEYKKDINDPNIPANVKKALQEDLKELQLLLDKYMNDFSDCQNNVNKIISDTLDEFAEPEEPKKEPITESKKAYYEMMKDIKSITSSERSEFYKIHGKSSDCSLAKDDDGYYVRTHRARSKSYKNIKDIPKKDVEFIRSTS